MTGSTFGLRLTINVEEYEYMAGAHTDTGIKVVRFHTLVVISFMRDDFISFEFLEMISEKMIVNCQHYVTVLFLDFISFQNDLQP